MSNKIENTMNNIENYLIERNHNVVSKIIGRQTGFLCEVLTDNRQYFEKIYVDDDSEQVIVEISPCICCESAYRVMLSEHINELNYQNKFCKFVLSNNGNVTISAMHSLGDCEMSKKTFSRFENILFVILFREEDLLDKKAHGIPESKREHKAAGLLKSLIDFPPMPMPSSLTDLDNKNKNDESIDEDDEDGDDGDEAFDENSEAQEISMAEFLDVLAMKRLEDE